MVQVLIGLAFIAFALIALTLQRLYSFIPSKELKRLTRQGDGLAGSLYKAAAYGSGLRLLLWVVAGTTLSAGIVLVVQGQSTFVGFILLVVVLALALVFIPSMRLATHNAWLPAAVAPFLGWVLSYAYRPLNSIVTIVNHFRSMEPHSRIYEKQDLLHLLSEQAEQPGNRIARQELELASRALHFRAKRAADVLTPRLSMYMVNADDSIGPVLLNNLHKHNQGLYLVYKDGKDNIVGSLSMQDALGAKEGGRVLDFVRPDLASVREDDTLGELLAVFQKTGQHLVLVINEFEEFMGSITLDSLLSELFGADDTSPKPTEVVE